MRSATDRSPTTRSDQAPAMVEAPVDAADLYRGHVLLDPRLASRHPAIARLWLRIYQRLRAEPDTAAELAAAFSAPSERSQRPRIVARACLRDVDRYLDDLLEPLPAPVREHLQTWPAIRHTDELMALMQMVFRGSHPRIAYEARRKLYLAKLLFDVDHSRSVRDGPRHQAALESLLRDAFWSELEDGGEVDVCCRLAEGTDRLEVGVPPSADARCWRFRVRTLPPRGAHPRLKIYHYHCRFKGEAVPAPTAGSEAGPRALGETPLWAALGRRSGSILSKMLRRGIADANVVQDLLGAQFIVGTVKQVYALERRLMERLGGPLRWRDRVDTLGGAHDRGRLNPRSSLGFQVLKAIVDVMITDPSGSAPYLFPVEVQLYPLEAYLRTVHEGHFASHVAYKRRQLAYDLVPLLFPREIYGLSESTC